MMSSADFQEQIRSTPANTSAWLLWADWLEENGLAGAAELLRLRTTLTQQITVPNRTALENRLRQLIHQDAILPPTVRFSNSIGLELELIPPGSFLMGTPRSEPDYSSGETQVQVQLTKPFYFGKYPITQLQYETILNDNPSFFITPDNNLDEAPPQKTDSHPVERVFYQEAEDFCQALTRQDRLLGIIGHNWAYQLPTEAQWEYACRAGTTTRFHFGSEFTGPEAYLQSITRSTTPVGNYPPNAFGLYDMHGNVWEWCQDWYTKPLRGGVDPLVKTKTNFRIFRGGCWSSTAAQARSAYRNFGPSRGRFHSLGFRIVLQKLD